jgi:uncharacterized membrane protein YedE/YeeE
MLFGIGMVLAGGCASRALVRIGTGDARALVVVAAMGLAAGASVDGVLEPARVALAAMSAIDLSAWGWRGQSLAEIASGLTGRLAPTTTGLAAGIALTVVSLASRPLWRSPRNVVAGLVIGLAVAGGFLVTGLAADEWARAPRPPVSLTFVRPAADVIDAVTVWAVPGHRAFAVASVVGVVVGAFLAGWAKGRLHWQGFVGWRDAALSLAGGLLMGIGGIAALGCTIGQGVTGLATLSLGAMIAVSGMIAGGFAGLRLLEQFRL